MPLTTMTNAVGPRGAALSQQGSGTLGQSVGTNVGRGVNIQINGTTHLLM